MYTQNSGRFYVHNGQGQAIRTYRIVVGYMYIYVMGRLIIHIQVNRERHCAYLQQGQAQPTCRIGVGSTHMQNRDRLDSHVEQGQAIHRYICQGQALCTYIATYILGVQVLCACRIGTTAPLECMECGIVRDVYIVVIISHICSSNTFCIQCFARFFQQS